MKIVLATLFLTTRLTFSAVADDWIILFHGKPTDQLRGYKSKAFPTNQWVIDGDALKTVPGKSRDLITVEKFKDFEMECEWKVKPAGNSGIIYNVVESPDATFMTGPEMQVLDDNGHGDGKNPLTAAGSLYALKAPDQGVKKLNPIGEWNKAKLVIKGTHVEHWLNGAKVVEYEWGSDEMKQWIAKSKFKDMKEFAQSTTGGHIAFQHHGEEVWYRNIRIRRL